MGENPPHEIAGINTGRGDVGDCECCNRLGVWIRHPFQSRDGSFKSSKQQPTYRLSAIDYKEIIFV